VPSTAPPAESESGTVSSVGYWNGKMAWDRADGMCLTARPLPSFVVREREAMSSVNCSMGAKPRDTAPRSAAGAADRARVIDLHDGQPGPGRRGDRMTTTGNMQAS
jgi:hypothetical protein